MMRSSLLLVEDDPKLGPLMVRVLSDVYEVRLCESISAAELAVEAMPPDVVIVDRRLPDGDGIDLVRALREKHNPAPILMLTALGTVEDRVDGLDAGANDYLVKPFAFDELLARLRALTRSYDPDDAAVTIGEWQFFPETASVYSPYEGRVMLSGKETELLALLASHPESVFSREQILCAVFDADSKPGTVDTYVHYIRGKTDRSLITTVRGRGYRIGAR